MENFWETYFSDCKSSENVQLICQDGVKHSHKLFLSAISNDLRTYMLSTPDWTEEVTILLPDFTIKQIDECFHSVMSPDSNTDAVSRSLGIFKFSKDENNFVPGQPIVKTIFDDNMQEEYYRDEYRLLEAMEQTLDVLEEENIRKRKRRKPELNLNKSQENLSCKHCQRVFKTEDSLFGHVTKKHPEEHDFLKYMEHLDQGDYQCTICKKVFNKKRKCNLHIRSKHKIGAKQECEICQDKFYFKHELNIHMAKHTQTKDAYCHLCGKGMRAAANLKKHMIAFHSNKVEKEMARTFFCTTCGKGFFTAGALKDHELLHSDNYNFQCSHCAKTFKQSAGLRTHFKRHHTEFTKTPEQKKRFAAYMQQYRARQKEKDKRSLIRENKSGTSEGGAKSPS